MMHAQFLVGLQKLKIIIIFVFRINKSLKYWKQVGIGGNRVKTKMEMITLKFIDIHTTLKQVLTVFEVKLELNIEVVVQCRI